MSRSSRGEQLPVPPGKSDDSVRVPSTGRVNIVLSATISEMNPINSPFTVVAAGLPL